jgi:hypothetical protein
MTALPDGLYELLLDERIRALALQLHHAIVEPIESISCRLHEHADSFRAT